MEVHHYRRFLIVFYFPFEPFFFSAEIEEIDQIFIENWAFKISGAVLPAFAFALL